MKYNEHHHHHRSHVLSVALHPSESMGWIGCSFGVELNSPKGQI